MSGELTRSQTQVQLDYTTSYRRSLFADYQGSIIAIADSLGSPAAINAYDAWGIPDAGNQGRFGYMDGNEFLQIYD